MQYDSKISKRLMFKSPQIKEIIKYKGGKKKKTIFKILKKILFFTFIIKFFETPSA